MRNMNRRSRPYSIKKSYIASDLEEIKAKDYSCTLQGNETFHEQVTESTTGEDILSNTSIPLPDEINVFKKLPADIYRNSAVREFLDAFRETLVRLQVTGVTLSPLIVTERAEDSIEISWIFNIFRCFFSFNNEGAFVGFVENNPEEQKFKAQSDKMEPSDYSEFSDAIITYVVMMLGGSTNN